MKLTLTSRALLAVALGAVALTPVVANAATSEARTPDGAVNQPSESSIARFEGKTLDLSKDWGEATACWVDDDGAATCYRTEADMDKALAVAGKLDVAKLGSPEQPAGARAAYCSSSVRLYTNNWFSGYVLYLSQRYTWISLSWYSFDNVTSAYKIGACSATFRSGSAGSGSTYWGATYSWANSWSMPSWNNVLSSLRIS